MGSGSEWKEAGSSCQGETEAINGTKYEGGTTAGVDLVKKVIARMKVKVSLLDITRLSQLRKDGHPSIYGNSNNTGNDCTHWCLAGVPDTWNQLLLYTLLPHH